MATNTQQDATYEQIMQFYDLSEQMIDVVEHGALDNPEAHAPAVKAFIAQVEKSTEILAETYITSVDADAPLHEADKRRAELAMRKILKPLKPFVLMSAAYYIRSW